MNIPDEIARLAHLRADGDLTEEEFTRLKSKLLDQHEASAFQDREPVPLSVIANAAGTAVGVRNIDINVWCVLIHLTRLIPGVGFLIPVILWQARKDESPLIDQNGKNVINWIISAAIYWAIGLVFCTIVVGGLILVGGLSLIALYLAGIIFTIVGSLKAYEGKAWPYPFSIRFFT